MQYIFTVKYFLALKRNECESVVEAQMKLQPLIQSEVSGKRKKMSYIYVESRKMVLMNLLAGQGQRCRWREWTFRHTSRKRKGKGKKEKEGKGETDWVIGS